LSSFVQPRLARRAAGLGMSAVTSAIGTATCMATLLGNLATIANFAILAIAFILEILHF